MVADEVVHLLQRLGGRLHDHVDAVAEHVESKSVTSAATSMSASARRSSPVISQSIHTSRSFTPPAYCQPGCLWADLDDVPSVGTRFVR